MIEVSISSVFPIAIAVSAIVALTVLSIYALCGGSKPQANPDVDMSALTGGNNTLSPPGAPGGAGIPAQRGNVNSYQYFKGSKEDGVINNAEAPETFKVGEKFDVKSLNFANISDFRGANVAQSSKIQNDRAKAKGGASGMLTSLQEADSDSYDSYDTEDEDEMLAPSNSASGRESPLPGQPPSPPNPKRAAYAADMDAGIQTFTGQRAPPPALMARGGAQNVIQSLAIARDISSAEIEASEMTKSKKVRKKRRTKKRVKKDMPEVERKRVKVRKKKRRDPEGGSSIREEAI